MADWFIGSAFLPSNKFPIIFHDVNGTTRSVKGSFSLFNTKEINVVVNYITELLKQKFNGKSISPTDIGVVSPYKLQCKQISRAIRNGEFGKIGVGTAEVFQGQERPIMIVSTVRSGGSDLGFVSEPRVSDSFNFIAFNGVYLWKRLFIRFIFHFQRLNVIITRAKCLLIIVGSRATLSQDSNWRELIEYCIDNRSLINWR